VWVRRGLSVCRSSVSEWTTVELDIPMDVQDLNGKREEEESKKNIEALSCALNISCRSGQGAPGI